MKTTKNKSQKFSGGMQNRLFHYMAFAFSSLFLLFANITLHAQNGAAQMSTAIENSKTDISGIFQSLSDVILVIGAIVGLVGGIQVFVKWNRGERDINKEIAAWGGSCVFLLIMGTILKTAFGL
jgi:hypothetical protein